MSLGGYTKIHSISGLLLANGALITIRNVCHPYQAAARAQLGGEAFAAAWADGRAMSLEEGVHYALEEA